MPQPNDADRPTSVLVEGGDIMRTLSLARITTLYYIDRNERYTQKAIADVIDCSRSSVSQYLQSMQMLPVALVTKQGQHYTITEAGEKVLSHVSKMFNRLGIDIQAIDWEDDVENIVDCLTPFNNARSTAPILLLYSIGSRGALGNRIELLGTPQSVHLEDVIQDVKTRQQERSESITRKRVQHLLRRFGEANTIEQDGHDITLTEKGHEQANLLEQLIQIVENQTEPDPEVDTGVESPSFPSSEALSRGHQVDNIAQQDDPRGFLDDARSTAQATTHDMPDIVPVYCLRSAQADSTDSDTQSDPRPLFPFTSLTLSELATHVGKLMGEYDGDVELEPYWALRTETGLYPLSPARFPLSEASHQAWEMVNTAHEVWEEISR